MARTGRRDRGPVEPAPAPVWPGIQGGRYEPLTRHELERIHETALDLMDQVGYAGAIPSMVELVTAAGGWVDEDGRLHFPRGLVEDVIAKAPRRLHLASQDGLHDLEIGGSRLYLGTAGAAPLTLEFGTDKTRPTTVADIYDISRLIDSLEHIHFNWRTAVARDTPSWESLDLNTLYALLTGSTKHATSSFANGASALRGIEMLDMVVGGEQARRERPIFSIACTFVVPPLRFAQDSCEALEVGVRAGVPVALVVAPQAGATGPVTLAGTLVQSAADVLAGLVFAYLIDPLCRVHLSLFPFVSDLRTGAMSGGSAEQGILAACGAQLIRFWDLPGSVAAGMTDSKIPDGQAGAEKAHTVTLAAHAGASMVLESAGMLASLMTTSLESLVIDNDMLGGVLRSVRGMEVNDETLAFDMIRDTVRGEGHFLGHPETLRRMRTDFLYPAVGDRLAPTAWEEAGEQDVRVRARERVREILSSHYPEHISEALDQKLRGSFDIVLERDAMRPGNSRW